ncbi:MULTISPECIES: proline dehydrogenase family protein [Prauserella salsuginis group]|uniref:proline dehydrogenase n=2 Tax=Prauserella salsuginis group TaxID=2893672 RepID=A0A839XY59_9PSEU|nr:MULTISPECIES: proline dehydrogenase family protein [Prauserella salsuginis group]MBB3666008.1 proline dehydrogenase [Prauserella sediminis]MCR3718900.1 L-proline dehydrogenase [Prauserella flava]MCR3733470.1 L-proline dehydrogenase [Prauserella salsuginis]
MPSPLRTSLLAAARSKRLERMASRLSLTRKVVDRFVAGETEQQALATSRDILDSGRFITIDHLGEDTTDTSQATATVQAYLSLLSALAPLAGEQAAAGGPRPVEVSLKLSALGQFVGADGDRIALENAHKICTAAEEAGVWVTVDAEDHTTTDSTLSIVRELRSDFPQLGTVLQAYLKRTEADCADLSGPGSRIRLCKGAYAEPASVAYQGDAVDEAYVRCLRVLMNGRGYPMVATHDPAMVQAGLRLATESGRGTDEYEMQMLYGVRDTEQLRLVGQQRHLRVYLPYGTEWYGYFMRRLAEKPANLALFLRALTSQK